MATAAAIPSRRLSHRPDDERRAAVAAGRMGSGKVGAATGAAGAATGVGVIGAAGADQTGSIGVDWVGSSDTVLSLAIRSAAR
jgi:hypothetical protein